MKRLIHISLLLVVAAFTTSCCDEVGCTDPEAVNYDPNAKADCHCCEYTMPSAEQGVVRVNFRLRNYGTAQNPGDTIQDYFTRPYIMEEVVMYLSNFQLMSSGGMTHVKDIVLVDFNDADIPQLVVDSVKPGNYTGFDFWLGVAPSWNALGPNSFPYSHELGQANSGYNWGALGYVFVRFGGRCDLDTSGSMESVFEYHIGTDPLYTAQVMSTPYTVVKGDTTDVFLYIDLDQVWIQGSDTINFATESSTHNYNATAIKFMDNYEHAINP